MGLDVPKADTKEVDLCRLPAWSVRERSSHVGDSEHLIPSGYASAVIQHHQSGSVAWRDGPTLLPLHP